MSIQRTGRYNDDVPALEDEIDRLRAALIQAGRAAGAVLSDQVSTDFLMHVPEEIRLKMERLHAYQQSLPPADEPSEVTVRRMRSEDWPDRQ